MWILNETFKRDGFSSINSILFFTVNLKAEHPEINKDLLVWANSDRVASLKCPSKLLERLRELWFKRVSELTGESIDVIFADDDEAMNKISNIK